MAERRHLTQVTLVTLFILAALPITIALPAPVLAQLFYCPERPIDRQYTAEPEPGCVPLVEEDPEPQRKENRPRSEAAPPVDLSDFQGTVVRFLTSYNGLIECCADDPGQLARVAELAKEADRLLEAAQRGMSSGVVKARGITLRELMVPITHATRNLRDLRARLERLQTMEAQVSLSDYETAGRLRRAVAEEKHAIRRQIQPIRLPESGRTGAGIQDSSIPARVGVEGDDDTSLPRASGQAPDLPGGETETLGPRTGAGIGQAGTSGGNVGQTPSTGFGIGSGSGPTGESSLPTRSGPDIAD